MGILTNEATVRQPRKQLCSTPFGIMGILTGGVANLAKVFVRAQRLSASWEFSLVLVSRSRISCEGAQRLSASWEFSQ